MRLSGLALAVFLVISTTIWAQHTSTSSGGGSSSGASSSGGSHGGGGGGGFSGGSSGGHSSGGGGSFSGGGGHSYGGGNSGGGHGYGGSSGGIHSSGSSPSFHGGSSVHGTSMRAPSSIESSRSVGREPASNLRYSPRGLNISPQLRVAPPEKRSFFSYLRHPFHRPDQKLTSKPTLVRPICFRGLCPPCPAGQARSGGCAAPVIPVQQNYACSYLGVWSGNCIGQMQLTDNCAGLRFALQQQLQRMQQAESIMEGNCQSGAQECSETTARWNSEASLYRALQARYRSCVAQTGMGYHFGGVTMAGYGSRVMFDPLFDGIY